MDLFKRHHERANLPTPEPTVLVCPHEGIEPERILYFNSLKDHLERTIRGEYWGEVVTTGPTPPDPITECVFFFYPPGAAQVELVEGQKAAVLSPTSASQLWLALTQDQFPDQYQEQVLTILEGAI